MNLIANDYLAISRRLTQLERERHRFVVPDGVVILLASRVTQGTKSPPCDICFIYHESVGRLTVLSTIDKSQVSLRINEFLAYFQQHYASANLVSGRYEIQLLERDDAIRLTADLQALV